ncbi:unnamed protein product [Auanema sp. JU1783]|nr:unnamed protein product [Auanema sp. JU1783]
MVAIEELKTRLQSLNPSILDVQDMSDGCGSKFSILIVSEAFEGKRTLQTHRLVQEAISDIMPQIHAVTIAAYTQAKYESVKQQAQ